MRRHLLTCFGLAGLLCGMDLAAARAAVVLLNGKAVLDGLVVERHEDRIVVLGRGGRETVHLGPDTRVGASSPSARFGSSEAGVVEFHLLHADPTGRELLVERLPWPEDGRVVSSLRLGGKDVTGFGIAQLEPHATDVYVVGTLREDGTLQAERVSFVVVGDPLERETPGLPRVLVIGDSISGNYNRALREALAGKVNVHHPPENCGGTRRALSNLHRWLGDSSAPGRQWDLIAFNVGLWNVRDAKESYQDSLRSLIGRLLATGARVLWVATTPVDFGFNLVDLGLQDYTVVPPHLRQTLRFEPMDPEGWRPGRSRIQNAWAAEVTAEFPSVGTVDLWQLVKNGEEGFYADWWFSKDVHFDYAQSVPLGRELARAILRSLAGDAAEINAMSVHASPAPELRAHPPVALPPTPIRVPPELPAASRDARWWASLPLASSSVDYDAAAGDDPLARAAARVGLAKRDLEQQLRWQDEGVVPPEAVARAREILERARSVLAEQQRAESLRRAASRRDGERAPEP